MAELAYDASRTGEPKVMTVQDRMHDQAVKGADLLERCHHHVSRIKGEAAEDENKSMPAPDFPGILYSLNDWDGALGGLARLESRLNDLAGQIGSL